MIRNGSIPAGAGKPSTQSDMMPTSGVYPRGRGEARDAETLHECDQGLSPRARGSPLRQRDDVVHLRSIPAGAGKP